MRLSLRPLVVLVCISEVSVRLIDSLLKDQRISQQRSRHCKAESRGARGLSSKLLMLLLMIISCALLASCDTGFGQKCTLPEGDAIQQACSAPQVEEGNEGSTTQTASATCALDNFPGCQTFLCLKYRGAQPYCSLKCQTSNECSGGVCCPLLGDCRGNSGGNNNGANDMISDPAQQMSVEPSDPCADGSAECYCIRQVDLQR